MENLVILDTSFNIDKLSNIPYYHQLKQFIIKEIEKGNWNSGQKMIPEIKLCERLNISRTVIRQTYRELVNEGYLIKKKAKGTFIASTKIRENLVQSLIGFYEDMTSKGFKVTNDIIYQRKMTPTSKIREVLRLKSEEKIVVIHRLRKLNDEPVVLDKTHLPSNMCPNLENEDFINKSLYSTLESQYNLKIERGTRYIEAKVASKKVSKLLNIKQGSPLLYIESINYLDDGTPVEYYTALHRGDRSKLVTELIRRRNNQNSISYPKGKISSGLIFKKN